MGPKSSTEQGQHSGHTRRLRTLDLDSQVAKAAQAWAISGGTGSVRLDQRSGASTSGALRAFGVGQALAVPGLERWWASQVRISLPAEDWWGLACPPSPWHPLAK